MIKFFTLAFVVFCLHISIVSAQTVTVSDAKEFLDRAEAQLLNLVVQYTNADWKRATDITDEHDQIAAKAYEEFINTTVGLVKESQKFRNLNLPEDLKRKFDLLTYSLTVAAPANPQESTELTQILTNLESMYGKGTYCKPDGTCLDLGELSQILTSSNNPEEMLDAWQGWHQIARPMRSSFAKYVSLANKGARELGFEDTGKLWNSRYEMSSDAFDKEVDRLWEQVKPLYTSLHAYVRKKLREKYGSDVVSENGPIPAHLLGNMWAQSWGGVYNIVAPKDLSPSYDLTNILQTNKIQPLEMIKFGEKFFMSLGFSPLADSFWNLSMFTKPSDREVICHASAWDFFLNDDVRLKMCTEQTADDFDTIHHELGHTFYQRAYSHQPFLFRDGANDGFHEAIGDSIQLSITPEYLVKIGLLDKAPDASKDIGLLLSRALEKVAFLPFGLLIDKWRWKVFSGEITEADYNRTWWDLRKKYQGIAPAIERTEADFDPGAKYHVAANVPYMRYFLAHILQFQFHRAMSKIAGCTSPLHRCSVYESKEAGDRLKSLLEMGASRPWSEALQVMSGETQMDASAILDYFAPLKKWLDEQNKGTVVGWE